MTMMEQALIPSLSILLRERDEHLRAAETEIAEMGVHITMLEQELNWSRSLGAHLMERATKAEEHCDALMQESKLTPRVLDLFNTALDRVRAAEADKVGLNGVVIRWGQQYAEMRLRAEKAEGELERFGERMAEARAEIEDDALYRYPQAHVEFNATQALIQCSMEAKIVLLDHLQSREEPV